MTIEEATQRIINELDPIRCGWIDTGTGYRHDDLPISLLQLNEVRELIAGFFWPGMCYFSGNGLIKADSMDHYHYMTREEIDESFKQS